jgi:hypothetical protein
MKRQKKETATVLALEEGLRHNDEPGASGMVSFAERGQGEEANVARQKEDTASASAGENEMTFEFDSRAGEGEGVEPEGPATFTTILRILRQPINPHLIKTREGWTDSQGNTHMIEYVEWHTVADILDRVAPTWSHSVRSLVQVGDTVAVTAAITIDGVTREGVGTGMAHSETGIKKAEHDALKRAAIKFGIARDLYQRESEVIEKHQPETVPTDEASHDPVVRPVPDPVAKSMADIVTPRQLGMIRALGREIGLDVDEECQAHLHCKTEELSKRAASNFIDHLKAQLQ